MFKRNKLFLRIEFILARSQIPNPMLKKTKYTYTTTLSALFKGKVFSLKRLVFAQYLRFPAIFTISNNI